MASTSVRLHDLAGDLRELPRSSMIAAARAVKKIAEEEGRPPFRLKKRTVKLKARDEITTAGGVTKCRVQGVPVGLWVIRNTGAGPHLIPRQGKRRKKPRYLAGGLSHPVVSPPVVIHHPGSSGNGAWRKVIARSQKVVPAIFREDLHRVVTHG